MKRHLYIFILLFTPLVASTQETAEWTAPDNYQDRVSPFVFENAAVSNGRDLYDKNCLSCHGNPGQGNYAQLDPLPHDPASEDFQDQSDGSLYYKITMGKGLMPAFQNVLSETERWNLVAYIRSFNDNYNQPEPRAPEEGTAKAGITLALTVIQEDSAILVKAEDANKKAIEDAEILLFAERYFGDLNLGESQFTNKEGVARFKFPKDLPGDKNGNVLIKAHLKSGESTAKIKAAIGKPTNIPSLTAQRAMWNVISKAPIWLIISYTGVVLGVWLTIFYIVYQLYILFKLGKEETGE